MGDAHKELGRLLAPHLALMRKELHKNWPDLDPELMLINWLCERNNLKPPQGSLRTKASKELVKQSPKVGEAKLPPLSARSAPEGAPRALPAPGGASPQPPAGPAPVTSRPVSSAAASLVATATKAGLQALEAPEEAEGGAYIDDMIIGLRSLDHVSSKVVNDATSYLNKMDQIRSGNDRVSGVIAHMRQDIRGKFIAKVPLLSSDVLTPEEQFKLVGKLRPWNFQAGQVVVREGDVGDELFIIERGTCEVRRTGADGKEYVATEINREDFFGELAVIYARPRGATVRAKTVATLLSLSKSDLTSTIGEEKTETLKVVARSRFFSSIPPLAGLSTKQKLLVTERLRIEHWQPGATLQVQNNHVTEGTRRLYIIEDGICREDVNVVTRDGTTSRSSTLVVGQYFGMLSMYYGAPKVSTITAESPATTLSLSYADLLEIFRTHEEGSEIDVIIAKAMKCYVVRKALSRIQELDDETVENICAHAEEVQYKRWQVLTQKGRSVDKVYVLVEGQATEHDGDVDALKDSDMQGEQRGHQRRLRRRHSAPALTEVDMAVDPSMDLELQKVTQKFWKAELMLKRALDDTEADTASPSCSSRARASSSCPKAWDVLLQRAVGGMSDAGDVPTCWQHETPGTAFGYECLQEKSEPAKSTVAASADSRVLCIPGIVLRGVLNVDGGVKGTVSKTDLSYLRQ